ncbi:endonuclease/exonuclease/phosphatase family protein [Pelagibius sp.]|uniref:endonuclease/exonuclease/phosphatase family protein n=1 Tax=Pelagibius sp. TaxID=1931238 RepID=UPI002637B4EF|nr:endonuclease/exonuclease/phosphatase family protein [Pelagibius sp.]
MPDEDRALSLAGPQAAERLSYDCVADLQGPDLATRRGYLALPPDPREHAALFDGWPLLRQLEVREPPATSPPAQSLRVVSWNVERGKYIEDSGELLRRVKPDVCLLTELDLGMARSGQRHTLRDLADYLDQGYVFAVEFIELSLGDERERVWHEGEDNARGLHGGGLLSPHLLRRPALLRLENSGTWWQKRFKGEARIGGRMAALATLDLDRTPITLAAVHFESHSGPAHRAEQMDLLLDAIEAYAPGAPVIIGGDFNTNTLERSDPAYHSLRRRLAEETPERFLRPEAFEPLFEVARAHGYDWTSCNLEAAPTTRTRPDGTPAPPHIKIDWFFTRGLVATDPAIVAAVDRQGDAISDHEALAVTVSLP